jgi:hypothetical protein
MLHFSNTNHFVYLSPVTELYIGIKYDPTGMAPDDIEFVMRHVSRSLKTNFLYETYRGKECKAVRVAAISTEKDKVSLRTIVYKSLMDFDHL